MKSLEYNLAQVKSAVYTDFYDYISGFSLNILYMFIYIHYIYMYVYMYFILILQMRESNLRWVEWWVKSHTIRITVESEFKS